MRNARVADLRPVQIEVMKILQCRQMREPRIGDGRAFQMQFGQVLQFGHLRQILIGHVRARKIQPRHLARKTRELRQLIVAHAGRRALKIDLQQRRLLIERQRQRAPTFNRRQRLRGCGRHALRQRGKHLFYAWAPRRARRGNDRAFRRRIEHRPFKHPLADQFRLFRGERVALPRHDIRMIRWQNNQVVNQTLFRLARDEYRAVLTALLDCFRRIQPQVALLAFRAVALDARSVQDGFDLRCETHARYRRRFRRCGRRRNPGPRRATVDPMNDRERLLRRQRGLARGRHHVRVFRRKADALHERARKRVARYERRLAALAALLRELQRIEPQPMLLGFGAVARQALRLQHGRDGLGRFRRGNILGNRPGCEDDNTGEAGGAHGPNHGKTLCPDYNCRDCQTVTLKNRIGRGQFGIRQATCIVRLGSCFHA